MAPRPPPPIATSRPRGGRAAPDWSSQILVSWCRTRERRGPRVPFVDAAAAREVAARNSGARRGAAPYNGTHSYAMLRVSNRTYRSPSISSVMKTNIDYLNVTGHILAIILLSQ